MGLSLRIKILILVNGLLFLALCSYMAVAISFFQSDKNETVKVQSHEDLKHVSKALLDLNADMRRYWGTQLGAPNRQVVEAFFREFPFLVEFWIGRFGEEKPLFSYLDPRVKSIRTSNGQTQSYFQLIVSDPKIGTQKFKNDFLVTPLGGLNGKRLSYWRLPLDQGLSREQGGLYLGLVVLSEKFESILKLTNYSVVALDSFHRVALSHGEVPSHLQNWWQEKSSEIRFAEEKRSQGSGSDIFFQMTEVDNSAGKKVFVASGEVPDSNLTLGFVLNSTIEFFAVQSLIERSLLIAILILLGSLVVSFRFSMTLTDSLKDLFLLTRKVARGDFSAQAPVTATDELGALAHSFNGMTNAIRHLLEETKENTRMQEELKTAMLVQENLFPASQFKSLGVEIQGFYLPSSECGGDWWTYSYNAPNLTFVICDVVGHGAPAALLTAAAHSAFWLIERQDLMTGKKDLLGPSTLLKALNFVVHQAAKGKMSMSAFVMVLNEETGEIKYSVASHDSPYLIRFNKGEPIKKSSIHPLLAMPGPSLGTSENADYEEETLQLEKGDGIVFFTDGITECRNGVGEMWTEGRFLRALTLCPSLEPETVMHTVLTKVKAFIGEAEVEDDMTLVVTRWTGPGSKS